jgi:hypothetical protein
MSDGTLQERETALLETVDGFKTAHYGLTVSEYPEPDQAAAWAAYAELRDVRAAMERERDAAARAIVRANTADAIAAGAVFTARNGYEKPGRDAQTLRVRFMLASEAKTLGYGQHINFIDNAGCIRRAKVNGQPKTWKRDANRVEVPLKYGLYETWRDSANVGVHGWPVMAHMVVDVDADGALTATV